MNFPSAHSRTALFLGSFLESGTATVCRLWCCASEPLVIPGCFFGGGSGAGAFRRHGVERDRW